MFDKPFMLYFPDLLGGLNQNILTEFVKGKIIDIVKIIKRKTWVAY